MSVLVWLGASILAAAMAGPEIIEQEEVHLSRGIDIIIILDQSLSMGVEDHPPVSRFDMAREMIRRFVLGPPGGFYRIGEFRLPSHSPVPPYR